MSDEKKNGRISLSTVATIAALIGGPFIVWGALNAEQGKQKEKVEQLEKRQAEDRRATRESINELKEHSKTIDHATQLILQEIRAMKAVQEAERRRR